LPPETYLSNNNRLMKYTVTECTDGIMNMMAGGGGFEDPMSGAPLGGEPPAGPMGPGGGGGGPCVDVSKTYYYYNDEGNVTNVFTENLAPVGGEKPYSSTALVYAKNNRTVTFAIGEEWTDETDYEAVWGREYRYDQARARYLRSVLDPVALSNGEYTGEAIWSQYDGDEIYADYTLNMGDVTVTTWYEPGIGMVEGVDATPVVKYYHGDLIGTTRFMTDSGGNKIEGAVYTAFGEPVNGDPRRFGFVGAYGYQTDTTPDTMTFLHVGHRYYDPSIGRFLQRDPIGIGGGLNVYSYVRGAPQTRVDPSGLQSAVHAVGTLVEGAEAVAGGIQNSLNDAKRAHMQADHLDCLPDPNCKECKRIDILLNKYKPRRYPKPPAPPTWHPPLLPPPDPDDGIEGPPAPVRPMCIVYPARRESYARRRPLRPTGITDRTPGCRQGNGMRRAAVC
jgi:RHS repeat-associated protein